jgi:antitoxin YefM
MQTTNATDLRKNLKSKLDIVSEDKETLIVHRAGQEDVVMITLAEFNSWNETNYLLSNKNNRERLLKGIQEVKEGTTTKVDIDNLWK